MAIPVIIAATGTATTTRGDDEGGPGTRDDITPPSEPIARRMGGGPGVLPSGRMAARRRALPPGTWLRALPIAAVAAVLIGVPSDLIDTPVFGRPVEVRPIDYVIWAVTSTLIGIVFAIRPEGHGTSGAVGDDTRPIWGGFVSFLAVGCPVCNQAVVLLVGTSGALSWWAPIQPLVGLGAVVLLVVALRRRLATYQLDACPLPGAGEPAELTSAS